MLAIARAGAAAGCTEALFTLGDKPELRYRSPAPSWRSSAARRRSSTSSRSRLVLDETGLLPHLNGRDDPEEPAALRPVSASMGIMLETLGRLAARAARTGPRRTSFRRGSRRSSSRGAPDPVHERDPDRDRRDARRAARGARGAGGGARAPRPSAGGDRAELPRQAGDADGVAPGAEPRRPPPGRSRPRGCCSRTTSPCRRRRTSPMTTFRGCSTPASTTGAASAPVTSTTSTREAPWPSGPPRLATRLQLAARLPSTRSTSGAWVDLAGAAGGCRVGLGLAREDGWHPGEAAPFLRRRARRAGGTGRAGRGARPALPRPRRRAPAGLRRRRPAGRRSAATRSATSSRNIQYTNVCYFRCGFCAFSRKLAANLRGAPYLVPHEEIVRRAREAWDRGATEVCLQGGIHPAFTGEYYASVVDAIRASCPPAHPRLLGARGLAGRGDARPRARGLPGAAALARPRLAAGTAAEILDDEMRAVICPDKVSTRRGSRCTTPRTASASART